MNNNYQQTGGSNASVVTSAVNGDIFSLSVVAGDYGSVATLLLQVGSMTATWTVTTILPNPTAFSIQATTVADPFSSASSGSFTVAGLPQGVSVPALLPCNPTTGSNSYYPNNGQSYCNSGSYFSLVNAYLNNQLISNTTLLQFYSGNIPFYSAVVASAPTALNGLLLGTCQVLVKNGDSVALSLAAPGLLNNTQSNGQYTYYSTWFNPGSGGYGMTQSIPITIGGVTAYWNVSVSSPTVQVAIGPTAPGPGQATNAGTTTSGRNCTPNMGYGTNYGTNISLQVAVPFSITLPQGTTSKSIRSVVVGVRAFGMNSNAAWAAVYADSNGSPGSVLTSGNSTAFYGQSGPAGLFGPATSAGQPSPCSSSSAQYVGPTLVGPNNVNINTGCIDSSNNLLEVVFPSGGITVTSGRYWMITSFNSNSSLPNLQLSTAAPSFGNVSITAPGGGSWVPYPSSPAYGNTTLCSPYLYIM